MVGLNLFLNMRCEHRCHDLHNIYWLDSYFLFLHWIIFSKNQFHKEGDIELKRKKYCFSIYNNFLSSFSSIVCEYVSYYFLPHFCLLQHTHIHPISDEKKIYGSIFLWNQEKYFTIILNMSNTYSTDSWESSLPFLLHISFFRIIFSWLCNCFWISDMNSLIYFEYTWILMNCNIFVYSYIKLTKTKNCHAIMLPYIFRTLNLIKMQFLRFFALALCYCTYSVSHINVL